MLSQTTTKKSWQSHLWQETWGPVHEWTISLRFLGIILRVPYTMFTLQTRFKPLLSRGGGVNLLVEVTVNCKENSEDFFPSYVQEFGLWSLLLVISKTEPVEREYYIALGNTFTLAWEPVEIFLRSACMVSASWRHKTRISQENKVFSCSLCGNKRLCLYASNGGS